MELKNQPIHKSVHNTLCINFRACAAFFPKIMYISLLDGNDIFQRVAIQSVDINFFKRFRSCLFRRFLIKTENEMKRRLWHRSKNFCITVRSDSNAP